MSTLTLALTSTTVTATAAPSTITASVTNSASVPARVVLGAFAAGGPAAPASPAPAPGAPLPQAGGPPPSGAAVLPGPDVRAWVEVERPLRAIAPGTTEQFTITVKPPPGTPAGEYGVRFIAYDADRPPEEYSDQARNLQVVVPPAPAPAKPGVPWWVWAVAAALVLLIGVVAFLVLRPGSAPEPTPAPPTTATPAPPTTATPTPAPNPCTAPFVPRLTRPEDLTCVTPLSAAEARSENDPELQRLRKDPSGPYGPETCVQGYVWREAYPGDTVCVTPATRTRTYWENQGHPEGTP